MDSYASGFGTDGFSDSAYEVDVEGCGETDGLGEHGAFEGADGMETFAVLHLDAG